ncbi:MAG: hypothetical protein K9N34_00510 [Candidatus Marinimicrobia bacterium]|nr:hypothetical protein [Candidatus Neomarinimicrobiota bacterium]MCF7840014.1 hypothetical protein [Candidatus Neomarinimicrobiota bacterium]
MAHAYTPGLKVLHATTIRKPRILPLKGKVTVEKGVEVKPESIVCSTNLPGNVQMVNVANLLNVEASEVPEMMKKSAGDTIKQGEMLAESAGIFGLFKSKVDSPTDGTIEQISSTTGQVVIREAPIPVEVDAYISGVVREVLPEEGVIIESKAALIQGIFGIGGETRGELKLLVSDRKEELKPDDIKPEYKGKILVGGNYVSLEAYRKAVSLGIAGIVTGGFDYNQLKEILGYTLGVAITGSEDLATTMVVTEGFGKVNMARRTFELLKSHDGHFASLNGATQIRAGVIRPEIVITLPAETAESEKQHDMSAGMGEDSLVRVIRAPYFGKLGHVKELPPELQKMESETMVRVAVIEFENGDVKTVPRANLEMVETD